MTAAGAESYLEQQEKRSRASRQQILDAAVRCLVEHGYAGASTLRIQELAGVSRGRLLHHFSSRDELLVGAIHHLASRRMAELRVDVGATTGAPHDDPARIDEAIEQMWATFQQPFFWASVELWVAARHNTALREVLGPAERELQKAILATLTTMFGPMWAGRPRFRQTADILLSSMRGVALAYGFDPRSAVRDPHLAQWREMARALLDAEGPD